MAIRHFGPLATGRHAIGKQKTAFALPGMLAKYEYKNNIFLLLKHVPCTKKGMGAVQFLTGHFTILGFQVQNWMLIAAAVIAASVIFVLATRDRNP